MRRGSTTFEPRSLEHLKEAEQGITPCIMGAQDESTVLEAANRLSVGDTIIPQLYSYATLRRAEQRFPTPIEQFKQDLKRHSYTVDIQKAETEKRSHFERMSLMAYRAQMAQCNVKEEILSAAARVNLTRRPNHHPICGLDKDWVIYEEYRGHTWVHRDMPITRPTRTFRRNRRSYMAPKIRQDVTDVLEFVDDQPTARNLEEINGTEYIPRRAVTQEAPRCEAELDERERFFNEAERMIRDAEFPADRMKALAAYSQIGSIDTEAYKENLLGQVRAGRRCYEALKQRQ